MYLKSFFVDLDAPAGIGHELVAIIEACQERAIETSDEMEQLQETHEKELDEQHVEFENEKEGLVDDKRELASKIAELEKKLSEMSVVSEGEKAKHRQTLAGIMQNLEEMEIG